MMRKISEFLSPALRSIRIDEQRKIDKELLKLYDEGLQNEITKFNIIPTISSLISITTSSYLRIPLYKYLNNNNDKDNDDEEDDENEDFIIPNLMCQITKSISNKLPSICIVTKSSSSSSELKPIEKITMMTEITNELIDIIKTKKNRLNICFDKKRGSILLNDDDCENIEELLSLINDAINNCKKYKIGKDLSFCLSFTDNPTFIKYNLDKKEYIIDDDKTYSNDTIIEYFNNLLNNHSEIEYLEDPLNELDQETYSILNSKINKNVKIIGNRLYSSLHELIENGIKKKLTSSCFISNTEIFTLTNILNISNMITKYNHDNDDNFELFISDNFNDNCLSSYCIDLSIACSASILRLSLPNSSLSNNKYNRWLMICDELISKTKQGQQQQQQNQEQQQHLQGQDKDEEEQQLMQQQEVQLNGVNDNNDKTEEALP